MEAPGGTQGLVGGGGQGSDVPGWIWKVGMRKYIFTDDRVLYDMIMRENEQNGNDTGIRVITEFCLLHRYHQIG